MDAKFHTLPPPKRFRHLQHEPSPLLPAKKRRESLDPPSISSDPAPTASWLPTKKRVWAPPPDFILPRPTSPFDLNLEYDPSSKEEEDDGIICAVCDSTDGDPSDPIVFCDGCDLMVHASCYGSPLSNGVPEGDWFCHHCLASQSTSSQGKSLTKNCCLCPVAAGALKPTKDGWWAHLNCALLVPEVFFEDPIGREGINCSKVPRRRWKEACYVCKGKHGCAVECSEVNCPLAFHVSCGLKAGLCIEYTEGKNGGIVAGFCRKHTQLWKEQQGTGKFKIVPRKEDKQKRV